MSILTHEHLSRQLDIVPMSILGEQINIIGSGAIGSWTCLALAKMGFKHIAVFDHDEVDIVNMSSQFFSHGDVGKSKVNALRDWIYSFTNERIMPVPEKWDGMKLRGVVIMAVDSMEVRRKIFEEHIGHHLCKHIIDARMGAETALLYTINPNLAEDQSFYLKSLYSDKDAVQERCTAKSTTYTALIQSGLVAKTVRDVLLGKKHMRNMTFSLKESDFLAFTKGENI